MLRPYSYALALLTAAVLAGCGSGSSGPSIDSGGARGSLVASPPILVPIPQADGTYRRAPRSETTTGVDSQQQGLTRRGSSRLH